MRVWNNIDKIWLTVMFLFLDDDGNVFHLRAKDIGSSPITDGWYDFNGDTLHHIALKGFINHNPELIPLDD